MSAKQAHASRDALGANITILPGSRQDVILRLYRLDRLNRQRVLDERKSHRFAGISQFATQPPRLASTP